MVHEWNIDDVNERIAEAEALNGGDFWIGGDGLLDEEAEEQDLRRRLVEGLQLESSQGQADAAGLAGNGLQGLLQDEEDLQSMEIDRPVIDPALL